MIEPWLTDVLPAGGRVAVDVGANVGSFTEWMAGRYERVFAFEPHPQAYAQLLAKCGGLRGVQTIEAAVGAHTGDLALQTFAESVHTAVDRDVLDTLGCGPAAGTILVPVLALDDADLAGVNGLGDETVDFVKIDVEGYECEVLAGAKNLLEQNQPTVLLEIHSAQNGDWCTWFLQDLGYQPVRIAHPHAGVPHGHHWLHAPRPCSE